MKAKEYAELYMQSEDRDKTIVEIGIQFLKDTTALIKARNAQTDTACSSILNEINGKWISFATIVNRKFPVISPIKYTGYKELIHEASPAMLSFWK